MATLTEAKRKELLAQYMSSGEMGSMSVTKADLLAAVAALDQFLETNRTAVNSAIPQPARAALTTNQKIRLLKFVLDLRLIEGVDG